MLFAVLAFAAVMLTYGMFTSKSSMLGFPSAIMWAILGGYAYNESAVAWDIWFIFAFACLLGMTTFCALGAYGLREKRDTLGDESMESSEGGYIDEDRRVKPVKREQEAADKSWYEDDGIPDGVAPSRRTSSPGRTSRTTTKRRGEFDF